MRRPAVLLLAAVLLPLAAPAQTNEDTGEETFGESIDVRVVNVEAVVTDRKGDRVQGLTAGDFRLLVDGVEVPIDYFTEVADGVALPARWGATIWSSSTRASSWRSTATSCSRSWSAIWTGSAPATAWPWWHSTVPSSTGW